MNNSIREEIPVKEIIEVCLNKNIPFVTYSLPNSDEWVTLIQYSAHPQHIDIRENLGNANGFLFSPFVENTRFPSYFLKPDLICKGLVSDKDNLNLLNSCNSFENFLNKNQEGYTTTQEEYVQAVTKIKEIIQTGQINKLVLSRVFQMKFPEDSSPLKVFETIHSKYPTAFRYIINIPEEGIWLGATPEPLLTVTNNQAVMVSLAGTQSLNSSRVDEVTWEEKELDEQNIVTQYIEEKIKKRGITEYSKTGPVTFQAAQLVHLQTQFSFSGELIKESFGDFILSIHPTPSISGMPKSKSLKLIPGFENYKRRYYSGFLGPVNSYREAHLFINLRCMRISDNQVSLYAGAGITAGSVPEKEWNETNHKLGTMLSVL
jgi:isochorismate synthase